VKVCENTQQPTANRGEKPFTLCHRAACRRYFAPSLVVLLII
jgi:hypothetical protein